MLTPTGDVKVMDFGIARAMSDASSAMTQTAAVVGTAQYLSPEQARGETVDSRSDVYSAGCLLFELLTGRPPFVGDSPVAVAYQHVREPAPPPSDFDTELPPEIDAIVLKSLAKRVEERYQSAEDMRSDIERYLAGRPVQAVVPPVGATAVVPAVAGAATAVTPPIEEDEEHRRTGWWIAAGLLVLALIIAGAFLLPRLFESPPEEVRVPNLVGLTEADAREEIGKAGLTVGDVTYEDSSDVKRDEVISQDPDRDTYVEPDSDVDFVVSSGVPRVEVPSVVGMKKNQARRVLTEQDFEVVLEERDSDEPAGEVVETDPAAGEEVPQGSTVTVFYSDGPESVPDVVGLLEDEAVRTLREAGFESVRVFTNGEPTDQPTGTVLEQNPEAGTEQPSDTQIVLIVTTYEQPSDSPSPTDSASPTDSPSATP
jgi:serine/threonine-protein kinase